MLELQAFQSSRWIQGVRAQAERSRDAWYLSFQIVPAPHTDWLPKLDFFDGKPDQIEMKLWERTCLECFFGISGQQTYYEFNGSPSGHWNLFRFNSIRTGMDRIAGGHQSQLVDHSEYRFRVGAEVFPVGPGSTIDRIGLTAIVAMNKIKLDREVSYWASSHGETRPDFHCADRWKDPVIEYK